VEAGYGSRNRGNFVILRQLDRAAIFRAGDEVLLDLARIDSAPTSN
jgi:hypothetical protein